MNMQMNNKVKTGIMQPYFLPYLGYWQLINAVDNFVLLDDVNYIKRGFINSNNILLNGMAHKFTIPLEKASQNKLIMDTQMKFIEDERNKLKKTIQLCYSKAPFFEQIFVLVDEMLSYDNQDLTEFIFNSINIIKRYLNINTPILKSSKIEKDNTLVAEKRIIEINKVLNSGIYINPIGGMQLYNSNHFEAEGIELHFLKMKDIKYIQFKNDFVPNLSILDVLMFNNIQKIKSMLEMYDLV